jgi:hypothetical protein
MTPRKSWPSQCTQQTRRPAYEIGWRRTRVLPNPAAPCSRISPLRRAIWGVGHMMSENEDERIEALESHGEPAEESEDDLGDGIKGATLSDR